MDIGDLHDYIALLENHQQIEFHSPAQIDQAIHLASTDLFWKFAPLAGTSKDAKAALDPFTQTYQVTPANSPGGVVTLPSGLPFPSPLNFGQLQSAMAVSYDNTLMKTIYFDIDMVNNDEKAQRLMSQIKKVTASRPIAVSMGGGVFQLYPQQPNTAEFTYLALPVRPKYGYTMPSRKPVYDPGSSTQLQWNEQFYSRIMDGALDYLGVSARDITLLKFMEQKQAS